MPEDDITTDLTFKSDQTSFKTLLSLVPAVYMTDYKDLNTTGEFSLSGSAKGVYSDADSTLPDIALNLSVNNGLISYPALPEKISNINLKADVFVDGKDMDKTTANIEKFHMELAGNPFDMTFAIKTPVSDPDIRGSMIGKIDLTALSNAIPLDSMNLSGIIDLSLKMAGRISTIEKGQYDKFQASGNMGIKNMLVEMSGYPGIKINNAAFEFSPASAALTGTDIRIGERSDFRINGKLENYLPYLFKDETIKGNLDLRSNMVDAAEILSMIAADTTEVKDTTALALIKIPENIDFDFNAQINDFRYGKIKAKNVKGHILLKNGVMSIRETGMNILGGTMAMNADYDTRDTLNPRLKADINIQSIAVKDGFEAFNTIQKLTPAAKGVEGKVNLKMTYESLLGSNMMPVISTITGGGKLQSDEITLLESATYDKMKELLKLGENYTNTFKDLNLSFNIKTGRIYVSPFDVKVGNIKMNIGGDQGIDQTMNYFIRTEIPRSELGNSVNSFIDGISAQASALGFSLKMPSDVMKINVRVTGLVGKPIVTPVFGTGTGESTAGLKATATETVNETAAKVVDEGKDKLRKEAEAQGDRLIKEAGERAQKLRDDAAKSAETIRKEADLRAQKLIDEASSKGPVAKLASQKAADTIRKEADKKATQLVQEADTRATKMVEEAKTKKEELINKI
jgi:vacuolar-type H+-ATPase subunit H